MLRHNTFLFTVNFTPSLKGLFVFSLYSIKYSQMLVARSLVADIEPCDLIEGYIYPFTRNVSFFIIAYQWVG